jgi:hypothetical protein
VKQVSQGVQVPVWKLFAIIQHGECLIDFFLCGCWISVEAAFIKG